MGVDLGPVIPTSLAPGDEFTPHGSLFLNLTVCFQPLSDDFGSVCVIFALFTFLGGSSFWTLRYDCRPRGVAFDLL